jgi:thiosulfate/3-mercaptopyruvate sulfurtransferase
MKRIWTAVAALAMTLAMALTSLSAAADDWKKLIEPAELANLINSTNVLVIDIRPQTGGKAGPGYAEGHIPGAVSAPYGMWRGPKENPGKVMGDKALTELLRGIGAKRQRPTVVAHQGRDATDFGSAARVYWTLKSAGLKKIAILNGGVAGWWLSGGPLTDDPVVVTPSEIEATLSDKWMMTRRDVQKVGNGASKATLLDARPMPFHNGAKKHKAASRAGTLPGAQQLAHSTWFEESSPYLTAPESVLSRLRKAGVDAGDAPVVSFCNTGHWAATNWFAASELAGMKDVKLYPESMVGWSNAGGQMANEK